LIACAEPAPSLRLVKYLKTENELRLRIPSELGQSDSVANLRRQFHIDPERSIARLHGNPVLWDQLLKGLKGGK